MATLQELQTALINADKAGDTDAARKIAAVLARAKADAASQIPGTQVPGTTPETPEPTAGQVAKGTGEAALTLATGATTGLVGGFGGFLKGLLEQVASGNIGTQEAVRAIEQSTAKGAAALTYAPRTESGQEQVEAIGGALQALPPVVPLAGELTSAIRAGAPAASMAAQRAAKAVQAPIAASVERAQELIKPNAPAARKAGGSVGAAGVDVDLMRTRQAESLPVPLAGESGLTKGQATRDFEQLQFEKETAKRSDLGAPLRERVENQSAVLAKNFDVLIDRIDPMTTELRDIGQSVDRALANKMGVANRKISAAYKAATEAGEMQAPVEMAPLSGKLAELERFEGVAPNVASIRKEAQRLGAVASDESGALIPKSITLKDSELLRQFVNTATDWTDKRQSMVARGINEAIDAATEGAGGDLYRKARALKRDYVNEFENVGLTKKLTTSKRGTDERQIAVADVFQKVIVDSPLDEMNKLRGTLINAGPQGKQAWNDLKAKGISYIKESSQSASQTDSRGNPLLSVDKLNKTVQRMDADGKLQSLYGKKQAQTIRDIAELSKVIHTAPPGAVNTSNTASALMTALDTVATFGTTGIPAPAVTVLREAVKHVKNRALKRRINEALQPVR